MVNGVEFWSTVYLGLDVDAATRSLLTDNLGEVELDDEEHERRMSVAQKRTRRKGLSLDNPTVKICAV